MGALHVAVHGQEVFTSSGTKAAIQHIERAVHQPAVPLKVTSDVPARDAVIQFLETGLMEMPGRTDQIGWVLYFILSMDTGEPGHSEKFRDHVLARDFHVELGIEFDLRAVLPKGTA